ncbi:hypothetical protein M0R19_05400 [Candidatus Pacearchaeota archaeon]|jgi:hypothetical protein|nr:hypothetical protein [Candidatus Pacearchaeota archaeon]
MESNSQKLYKDIMSYIEENELVYLWEEEDIGFPIVDEDEPWDFSSTILEAYKGQFPWAKSDLEVFVGVRIWTELWKLLNPGKEPEYLSEE